MSSAVLKDDRKVAAPEEPELVEVELVSQNTIPADYEDEYYDDEPVTMAGAREVPAWAISLAVHLAIMFALWTITRTTFSEPDIVLTSTIDDVDSLEYKFDTTRADQIGNESNAMLLSPSLAAAEIASRDPQEEMKRQLDEQLLTVDDPPRDEIETPAEDELTATFDAIGSTKHTGGVEGSMDMLTREIVGSLERKTLVIWLFDASQSLNKRRNDIADRFENVYRQLGMLKVGEDRALKTAVASYGASTNLLTPTPVDDVKDVVQAIRNIKPETGSSRENVFAAVQMVTNKWLTYRTKMRRNVMVIIVTDERGDDVDKLEITIQRLRRYGIRVYCVGDAAIFGREKGYVSWTYSDGFTEDVEVDRGPETVAAERLRLPFWAVSGRGLNEMSSGYGPYALTRLCAETGGMYLITEDTRGPRFDPDMMRNYLPDYRPIRDYGEQLRTNQAKGQLVRAARMTKVTGMPRPQLTFRAENDNVLRVEIGAAQRPLAELDLQLKEMERMLSIGERDRPKLTEPRWQASFDLAMGRVMAMRARAYGYNLVLAQMKTLPKSFEKKGSNSWRLVPSVELIGGAPQKKLAKKAAEYLTRVIDDHAGTPWAMLAERELSQPLGWDWQEYTRSDPQMARAAAANTPEARLLLAREEQRRREMQRKATKKRTKPNL